MNRTPSASTDPRAVAVTLLQDLRDLSERNGHSAEFTRRLEALRQAHATKPSFLAPLTKARL